MRAAEASLLRSVDMPEVEHVEAGEDLQLSRVLESPNGDPCRLGAAEMLGADALQRQACEVAGVAAFGAHLVAQVLQVLARGQRDTSLSGPVADGTSERVDAESLLLVEIREHR